MTRRIATEIALVYISVAVVIFLLVHGRLFDSHGSLLVSVLFLGVPVLKARRDPRGPRHYGVDLAGMLTPPPPGTTYREDLRGLLRVTLPQAVRELCVAIGVMAPIAALYALGFYFWHRPQSSFVWMSTVEVFDLFWGQLLMIALPEEFFFRGYLQTRLSELFPKQHKVLGVRLSRPAWLLQALLFALMHLIRGPFVPRLAVFFPGLLFGFLRSSRQGVGAAIVVHALCNVLSALLTYGWLAS